MVDESVLGILSSAKTFGNGGYAVMIITLFIHTNNGQALLACVALITLLSMVLGHLIPVDVFLLAILTPLVHEGTDTLVLCGLLGKHLKSTSLIGSTLDDSERATLAVDEEVSVV